MPTISPQDVDIATNYNPIPNESGGDKLRSLVARIEKLAEEKQEIADAIAEVYAEAKADGFDTKIMRECVKLRKMEADERREREEMIRLYGQQLEIFA